MAGGLQREDGATAIIVAICLLLLFGAGAIAVDLGSAWDTKRNLVVDTDAAALAGASALAETAGTCTTAATAAAELLSANLGQTVTAAQLTSGAGGSLVCDQPNRRVTVGWTGQAQQTLSGALGTTQLDVYSSSTAQAAQTLIGGGLRPFSVCMSDPEVQAWLAGDGNVDGQGGSDAGGTPDSPNTHRLLHDKTWDGPGGGCGGAAGNWGLVCYEKFFGGTNQCNAGGLGDMVLGGYDGLVDLETPAPDDGDCAPATGSDDDCDGQTGIIASLKDDLDAIECPAATVATDCAYQFPILGINTFTGGPGTTATLHPTHFVGVVLRDSTFTGPSADRHVTFELVNLFDEGTSALLDHGTPTETNIALCGADAVGDFCD